MTTRNKSDSIGPLGRAPARTSPLPPFAMPPQRNEPPDRKAWLRHHLREAFLGNIGLKFLSLVLALTVFLLVNTGRDREITTRVLVGYTLPVDRVLVSPRLTEVRIGLRGPWRRVRRFEPREIDPIDLDLRSAQDGEIVITPDMVHLPAGLTLTSISPRTLKVAFEKRIERPVEITPVVAGRPAHGYVVASIKADPATAKAVGAEGKINDLASLRTREIRVDGLSDPLTTEVPLVPPDGVDADVKGMVSVTVEIKEQLETRRLGKLAVRVMGDGVAEISVLADPPAVEVVPTGTVKAVEQAVLAGIVPTVKVTAADAGKKRTAVVAVEGLPPGVGVELVPAKIELAPVAPAPPVTPGPRPRPAPKPAPPKAPGPEP